MAHPPPHPRPLPGGEGEQRQDDIRKTSDLVSSPGEGGVRARQSQGEHTRLFGCHTLRFRVAPIISTTFPANPVCIAAPCPVISSRRGLGAAVIMPRRDFPQQTRYSTTGRAWKSGQEAGHSWRISRKWSAARTVRRGCCRPGDAPAWHVQGRPEGHTRAMIRRSADAGRHGV